MNNSAPADTNVKYDGDIFLSMMFSFRLLFAIAFPFSSLSTVREATFSFMMSRLTTISLRYARYMAVARYDGQRHEA